MHKVTIDNDHLKTGRFEVVTRALDSLYFTEISDTVDIGLFQKMAFDGMKTFGFNFRMIGETVKIDYPTDIPDGKLLVESDGTFVKFSFTDNPNLPIII